MQQHEDSGLSSIDTSKPSIARMYDYYLGGKDNFQVDRDIVEQLPMPLSEVRRLALANRAFLKRAVQYMARRGIRQFLDIGSGLPTQQNTHEVAQEIAPDARVVYIDNDPAVQTFGRALMATDDNTAVVAADMCSPAEVLEHPDTARLIDFNEPVGVLMIAVAHFLSDEQCALVIGRLRDVVAPGSFLALTHATSDGLPSEAVEQGESLSRDTSIPAYLRDHAAIVRFFDGFDLVGPGLVTLDSWWPDSRTSSPEDEGFWSGAYGAVGRKS